MKEKTFNISNKLELYSPTEQKTKEFLRRLKAQKYSCKMSRRGSFLISLNNLDIAIITPNGEMKHRSQYSYEALELYSVFIDVDDYVTAYENAAVKHGYREMLKWNNYCLIAKELEPDGFDFVSCLKIKGFYFDKSHFAEFEDAKNHFLKRSGLIVDD